MTADVSDDVVANALQSLIRDDGKTGDETVEHTEPMETADGTGVELLRLGLSTGVDGSWFEMKNIVHMEFQDLLLLGPVHCQKRCQLSAKHRPGRFGKGAK